MTTESAYAAAGVDIAAGDRAVELMKASVARSYRPEVLGGLGGFAGFFDASALATYRHPVLATSTDGVGTKVAIAGAMGVYDTIGFDLIGMLVDDLVVTGAEPLFVTDSIACGKVFPERIAATPLSFAGAAVKERVTIDGNKYILEDGSWLLFRKSGTEPVVRLYCEASSEDRLQALIAAGREFIVGKA